ncbi:hypothetical protein ACH5A3_23440 [Streptomyces echinatus]|uniref:hypothetical protein n=1 Tax=Streptomyces echinatus TaxID=67293 RepID=UPI00379D5973
MGVRRLLSSSDALTLLLGAGDLSPVEEAAVRARVQRGLAGVPPEAADRIRRLLTEHLTR